MNFDFSSEPGLIRKNRYSIIHDETPLVSIITPFYNAGKYIQQTFHCVINQTFPWFEWIIVDDGSTVEDDKEKLIQLAKEDCRIHVYRKDNGGAAGARNYGIEQSRSDIIVFLDADDLIRERFVECHYWALKKNPKAQWAFADSVGFFGKEYIWNPEFSSERMKEENTLPYCAAIRKRVFTEDKLYDNDSKNLWEDYQLWLKLLVKGYFPVHIDQILFWYRRLDSGELAKIDNNLEQKKVLQRRIKDLAKDVPDGIRAVTFRGKRIKEFVKPQQWHFEKKLPFTENKIRILMLLPHMECGGADKFNLDVIKNINHNCFEIGIITTVPAESEWRQEFEKYADDIFELPSFLDINDWAGFIHYYIETRDVKILWNISSYYGYYALPWLRIEFPELAIIDCVHAEGKYWRGGGYPRVSASIDSVLEKTFVTNDFTRNILVEKYGKKREKTQVIYTGVDETDFESEKIDAGTIRQQYGITENQPVVLYLCRMSAEKRPFLMLEIAKEVRKTIPDVCFLAVGGGPQLDELKMKASNEALQSTVLFTARVQDVKPFYKVGDLFLLCSIKEGLSITTLEAMLMETPVVSADVASQYELVNDQTGVLIPCRQDEEKDFDKRSFPKEEIQDYSHAICDLLLDHDKRKRMQKACRDKILDGFTLRVLMATLEREFSSLCSASALAKRRIISDSLTSFSDLAIDYLTLYQTYENKDMEAAEIWHSREWYRSLFEQERTKHNEDETAQIMQINSTTMPGSLAEQKLNEIYAMRSWKLVNKYQQFMDKTRIGRILQKIRDLFFRLTRK